MFGTRTETKNVNSLRSVERAVRHEMDRQAGVLDAGGAIVQETRHFDESVGTTSAGRRKETSEDYRYFPEPDLVPIAPSVEWVDNLRPTLPELPWQHRERVQREWNLSAAELRDIYNAGALDLISATVDAGAHAGRGPLVVGLLPGPTGERAGRRAGRAADHARNRSPGSPSWSGTAR